MSYALTNRDLRHAYLHPVKGELAAVPEIYTSCPYPENITMGNLTYFWWAPTLIYQPVYPRTENIRWIFVFKRLGETACLSVFIWFCSAQYAAPVLWNSLDKMHSLDLVSIVERLLKLSTISLVIWLAGFFALFQSALNALAEIMRFWRSLLLRRMVEFGWIGTVLATLEQAGIPVHEATPLLSSGGSGLQQQRC
ncbi:hypothetical protein RRF57_012412 [Xylaria bambusicola]|uniref:diacylglycerol O-acyltransferase n=1 Tax=Xylaria bambusicola TaxID=326684 RepID=A0AAN7UPP1_9PEZI